MDDGNASPATSASNRNKSSQAKATREEAWHENS
jgi:hypothetical protein